MEERHCVYPPILNIPKFEFKIFVLNVFIVVKSEVHSANQISSSMHTSCSVPIKHGIWFWLGVTKQIYN